MKTGTLVLLAAAIGVICPTVAAAQTSEPTSTVPPGGSDADAIPVAPQASGTEKTPQAEEAIPEIVVTARRTAESLESVPVSISAFSSDDLKREQITNGQDLQGRVPSLTIGANSQQRSTEAPTIRGQGSTFGASPGVVIYMAEVPVPADVATNGQGGPGKFFDLTNLQVLKGSQGTLFGRNTTGGALLLEPHKPDDRYEFEVRNQNSNFSGDTAEGILNVPLLPNTLLLRVAAQYNT